MLGMSAPGGKGMTAACILATLLAPTSGRAEVDGLDVVRDAEELRFRIGLAGQSGGRREPHGAWRTRAGRAPLSPAQDRGATKGRRGPRTLRADRGRRSALEDLLRRHAPASRPGGEPRGRPEILFLDEPTTDSTLEATDVDFVRELQAGGHDAAAHDAVLDEADRSADCTR